MEAALSDLEIEHRLKHDDILDVDLCEVCGEELELEGEEDEDKVLECSKCHMKVHKGCFYVSDNDLKSGFTCDLCKARFKKTPACLFCPINCIRAMKCTDNKKSWAHVTCIQYISGLYLNDKNHLDGIDYVEDGFFNIHCVFCKRQHKQRYGAVIQCSKGRCVTGFHPLCGRAYGCYLGWNDEDDHVEQFCLKHLPLDHSPLCPRCHQRIKKNSIGCMTCHTVYHRNCVRSLLKSRTLKSCPTCNDELAKKDDEDIEKEDSSSPTKRTMEEEGEEMNHTVAVRDLASPMKEKRKQKEEVSSPPEADQAESSSPATKPQEEPTQESVTPPLVNGSIPTPATPSSLSLTELTPPSNTPLTLDIDIDTTLENEGKSYSEMQKSKNANAFKTSPQNVDFPSISDSFKHIQKKYQLKHLEQKKLLRFLYTSDYEKWISELKAGFNLLFFGYGSKINVLTNFINSALISNNVLVIKGFIPHLTIYDILAGLYNLYPMIEKKYKNIEKQIQYIRSYLSDHILPDLYICIHSFDGPLFRNNQMHEYLTQLISCKKVHLFASCDTIKYNIYIPPRFADLYHFVYHNVSTYESYIEEKSYMSFDFKSKHMRSSSGLYFILSSLTDTHLKVLKLLAQRCETNSQGLAFDELYDLCYSRLFVKNRPALNMILRELQDHQVVHETMNLETHKPYYLTTIKVDDLQAIEKKIKTKSS